MRVDLRTVGPADLEPVEARQLAGDAGMANPTTRELGRETESWYADLMGGGPDVNPELSGRLKYPVYDEMRKTDASVKSTLWMMKLPIRSAVWDVEARSQDPVDLYAADVVRWNLGLGGEDGQMVHSWDESLEQALQFLDWGSMLEELLWAEELVPFVDAGGETRMLRPIEYVAPRMPATIDRVSFKRGRIVEVRQSVADSSPIPGSKVSWLVLEREPGRWDGVSLLRPMWGPWRLKKALMVAAGIGWDRFASGIPVIRYPAGGDKTKADKIGRSVRQHERAYVTLEGAREAGWDFELVSGAGSLADPVPLLRQFSAEIGEAGLQQFSKLGTTESGSRAVGEVLADPFYLAVQALAGYVAQERTRQVARRIVDVNVGTAVRTPRIRASKIQARSLQVLAQVIADLSAAGFSFADRATQNDVRDLMELEHLPEAEQAMGLSRGELEASLRAAGIDPALLAGLIAQLPDDVGIVPAAGLPPAREGDSIQPMLPPARSMAALERARIAAARAPR